MNLSACSCVGVSKICAAVGTQPAIGLTHGPGDVSGKLLRVTME